MQKVKDWLIKDIVLMTVIFINSFVLFLYGFPFFKTHYGQSLFWLDYACTVYFLIEVLLKIEKKTWAGYWGNLWSRFDFFVFLISSPMLLAPFLDTAEFGVILIFRLGRIFRFFRIAQFIPSYGQLMHGLMRALKASVGVSLALMVYLFVLGILTHFLFGHIDTEHFSNPMASIYTMFKMFTLDDWAVIPDTIAASSTPVMGIVVRLYFAFVILSGGIIGLSLVNAVFVDEMLMDNTNELDHKLDQLMNEITSLKKQLSKG